MMILLLDRDKTDLKCLHAAHKFEGANQFVESLYEIWMLCFKAAKEAATVNCIVVDIDLLSSQFDPCDSGQHPNLTGLRLLSENAPLIIIDTKMKINVAHINNADVEIVYNSTELWECMCKHCILKIEGET